MTDQELLKAYIERGSTDALQIIANRYRNLIYKICLTSLGNADDADDAVQATLILLQKSAKRIRQPDRLAGWLAGTANHVCNNARRERSRRQKWEGTNLKEAEGRTADLSTNFMPELATAMAGLGEDDHRILALRFFQGMSVKEVGVALGIREQAAQTRLGRAIERLRKNMAGLGCLLTSDQVAQQLQSVPGRGHELLIPKESNHRWATPQRPNFQRIGMRAALAIGLGFTTMVAILPPVVAVRSGLARPGLMAFFESWSFVNGQLFSKHEFKELGTWQRINPQPVGALSKQIERITVLRDGLGTTQLMIQRKNKVLDHGKVVEEVNERSFEFIKFGDRYLYNGSPVQSSSSDPFLLDGEMIVLTESDRRAEGYRVFKQGSTLAVEFQIGGSIRTLKTSDHFEGTRVTSEEAQRTTLDTI